MSKTLFFINGLLVNGCGDYDQNIRFQLDEGFWKEVVLAWASVPPDIAELVAERTGSMPEQIAIFEYDDKGFLVTAVESNTTTTLKDLKERYKHKFSAVTVPNKCIDGTIFFD